MATNKVFVHESIIVLISAQCLFLVLFVGFLNYDSKADASDIRNALHHVKGGFNIKTLSVIFMKQHKCNFPFYIIILYNELLTIIYLITY